MVAYCTGSDPIRIGDFGPKVKVTVTKSVCKNDEKKVTKKSNLDIFKIRSYHSIENVITFILIPNMTILKNK